MARTIRSARIGLHHLRSAIAAADCGSFRQAAELLEVRHSVLSRSISQFEHLLGVTLFDRSTGGVVPTVAGRSALRMSRLILEQLDSLLIASRAHGYGEAGRLSVGFSTSMSIGDLRATLAEFKRRTPQVELSTFERSRVRLMRALRSGTIDIAIAPGFSASCSQGSLQVWNERILILLDKDHRLAARDIVNWTDLHGETVILGRQDPASQIEDLIVSKLIARDDRPKIERHDVSRDIVKSLISMGLGIGLVMESDIGACFSGLDYRELQDGTGPSRIGFYAHWLKDNDNPALKRFLSLLSERYPFPIAAPE
ncbi:LysR family transcriptional regulator [Bradyrhizobium sp. cir1]|uniref:LysR family transcriptional regulator n=1 Tax=Bradyrhizobium sp. cir1 TaxID=1445730 RepID=UPI001605787F|nr:LysR family transcriptional regulator [Bradyrhizobium sp. cir1]